MKRVLFICGRNRARSPTAENVFGDYSDIETASAGTSPDADTPLSSELVEWADIIFMMEPVHRRKLSTQFRTSLKSKRVICLDIPDKYDFMDPELVRILKAKGGAVSGVMVPVHRLHAQKAILKWCLGVES